MIKQEILKEGKHNFLKLTFTEIRLLDGYNREKVLPLIIQKLTQLGYIEKHENGEISLTQLGIKHCGEEIVLNEIH